MPIISAQYHRLEMFAKSRIISTWFHCVLVLFVIHMGLCLSQVDGLPEPFFTVVYAFVPKVDVEGLGTSGMAWQLEKIKQTIITQNNTILLQ